jgi:3-hydroxyacyl-CoA dehydrogenase
VLETDAVRMWTTGDDIGVVSFKSKMHTIGEDVLDGILQAIDEAQRGFQGLIIWQTEPPFSLGANLQGPSAARKSDQKPSGFAKMMKGFRREAESMVLKAARKLNVADALMAGRLEKVEAWWRSFRRRRRPGSARWCRRSAVGHGAGRRLRAHRRTPPGWLRGESPVW